MKKRLVVLIAFFMIGCQSDDDNNEPPVDLTALFLEETTPQFTAEIDGQPYTWKFGLSQYQTNMGTFYTEEFGGSLRYLRFALLEDDGNNDDGQVVLSCFLRRIPNNAPCSCINR